MRRSRGSRLYIYIALFAALLLFLLWASGNAFGQTAVIDEFLTRYPLVEGVRTDSTGYEIRADSTDTLRVVYDVYSDPAGWMLTTADSVCTRLYLPGVSCVGRASFEAWKGKQDEYTQPVDFEQVFEAVWSRSQSR